MRRNISTPDIEPPYYTRPGDLFSTSEKNTIKENRRKNGTRYRTIYPAFFQRNPDVQNVVKMLLTFFTQGIFTPENFVISSKYVHRKKRQKQRLKHCKSKFQSCGRTANVTPDMVSLGPYSSYHNQKSSDYQSASFIPNCYPGYVVRI